MDETTNQGAAIAPAAPSPAPVADATPAQSAAASDEPLVSKREIVELRKETRETKKAIDAVIDQLKKLVPTPKAAPDSAPTVSPRATPDDATAHRLRVLEFRETLTEAGITDKTQREWLSQQYVATNSDDPSAWLSGAIGALGITKPQTTHPAPGQSPPPVQPSAPPSSNSGPPAGSRPAYGNQSVLDMDPSVYRALPKEEKDKLHRAFLSGPGPNTNPFIGADRKK
jgi:hypothetical protein